MSDIELVAQSRPMRELLAAALDVAPTPTTVLITGESGAGKEVLARWLHGASPRAGLPFVVVPCATFQRSTVEAALRTGGTVLIDELSALEVDAQAELLGLLEAPRSSRVIATSNRDLARLVERGTLRSDLYYRLDVYPLDVPPLRERTEDIAVLADMLLTRATAELGRVPLRLTGAGKAALEHAPWPGNVRELANVLERSAIRVRGPLLDAGDLPIAPPPAPATSFPAHLPLDLAQLERLAIAEALRRSGGNRTHAARLLCIGLRTLRQKLNGPARASVTFEAPAPSGDPR